MNFYYLFLLLSTTNGEKIIRNANINACKDCVYFKPFFFNSLSSGLGKCEKFGNKNIVSNEITYDFAELCRRDEDKCGESGKYFEEENEAIKMFKYNIFIHSPYGFIILITFANALLNVSFK